MNVLWNNVIEQNKTKAILNKLLSTRRVPHAFIFSGPEGIGKFHTAIQFAKILSQELSIKNSEAVFNKIDSLQEPYIKYIFPLPRGKGESADDNATDKLSKDQLSIIHKEIQKKIINPFHKIVIEEANTIKISSIREIKKFITTSYDTNIPRFVIIDDAHLMNDQSQNALLKTLEEPPIGFYFFLITSYKEKLLPTIQSRSWCIDFEPLSNLAIEKVLESYYDFDIEKVKAVSIFSEGSVITALKLLESDFLDLLEKIISILRYSIAKRYLSAIKQLNEVIEMYPNIEFKEIIKLIKIWLSDVIKNKFSNECMYYRIFKDTIEKFNQKFIDADIKIIFKKLEDLEDYYNRSLNLNVLTLNLIFELARITIRK